MTDMAQGDARLFSAAIDEIWHLRGAAAFTHREIASHVELRSLSQVIVRYLTQAMERTRLAANGQAKLALGNIYVPAIDLAMLGAGAEKPDILFDEWAATIPADLAHDSKFEVPEGALIAAFEELRALRRYLAFERSKLVHLSTRTVFSKARVESLRDNATILAALAAGDGATVMADIPSERIWDALRAVGAKTLLTDSLYAAERSSATRA